jgi:hypothetical protein
MNSRASRNNAKAKDKRFGSGSNSMLKRSCSFSVCAKNQNQLLKIKKCDSEKVSLLFISLLVLI